MCAAPAHKDQERVYKPRSSESVLTTASSSIPDRRQSHAVLPYFLRKRPKEPKSPVPSHPLQQELLEIFKTSDRYMSSAENIRLFLEEHCPSEHQELDQLIKDHPTIIQELKEKGWKSLKTERKEAMATDKQDGHTIEEFRHLIVNAVTDLCVASMRAMGFDSPGKFTAFGTPGWDSDIDTAYEAAPGASVPEKFKILQKLMFDAIFYAKFAKSSGYLFDTECYVTHSGATNNTEIKLETLQGQQLYSTLELNAATLQLVVQTPEEERKPLIDELRGYVGEKLEGSLSAAFDQAEALDKLIREEIEKIQRTGVSEELAYMEFKNTILLWISEEMDNAHAKLQTTPSRRSSLAHAFTRNNSPEQKDLLHLRIATLDLLRLRFFDEGYLSQGAYRKICETSGGQKCQRAFANHRKSLSDLYASDGDMDTQSLAESPLKLSPEQKTESTPLQNVISAFENLAMYLGHFRHALHGSHDAKTLKTAFVNTSKYSERILSNALAAVESQEEDSNSKLRARLIKAHFRATELEKVKRKTVLNYATTRRLLIEELSKGRSEEEQKTIELIVERIVSNSEANLEALQSEATILPQDLYKKLLSLLIKYKKELLFDPNVSPNNATMLPLTKNDQINAILKARCGLDPTNPLVQACHQRALEITLDGHNAQTIEEHNTNLKKLTMQALKRAGKRQSIALPHNDLKGISPLDLFQQAMRTRATN